MSPDRPAAPANVAAANVAAAPASRPPRRYAAVLTALATVLAWNLLLLGGWMVWVLLSAREQTGWEDLVAIVGAMIGTAGFLVSAGLGALAAAVMHRRGRWRDRAPATGHAIGHGTLAAAIGVAPLVILVLVAAVTS